MLLNSMTSPGVPLASLRDMVRAFANAMNLIDPEVENHHEKVCCLSLQIADQLNFREEEKRMTFYGALLHDVGAIALQGRSLAELEHTPELINIGVNILRDLHAGLPLADIVARSQTPWQMLRSIHSLHQQAILIPQVIYLADSVAQLLMEDEPVLNQLPRIRRCIDDLGEKMFHPKVTEAFHQICGREILWFDLQYRPETFLEFIPADQMVSLQETLKLTDFMSQIIDYRSHFTAMHSAGVAATAVRLAKICGMDEQKCLMMQIAGHLHDIGKLKIPTEILEKPGPLTDEEFNIMKEHAFFSYVLLSQIRGFEDITVWAAFHHEKLNGSGYPFHYGAEDLPLESRIMATADVFSAITEDRPYRAGMERDKAISVLRSDAQRGALCAHVVEMLISHFDEINAAREDASKKAGLRYRRMLRSDQSAKPGRLTKKIR